MSATVARNGGDHCEAVLLGAIGRYDIKKFLVAASASRFGVISDEERTGIFRDAQNNQKIRDDFQSLIVGKGRLKSLAAFILDYNSHVQEAAQEVLKRLTLTSAGIESEVCPLKNRNRGSSFSSSSGTPPSPMDIDYQHYLYSQEGDMPSQHPPDFGYCSDLSKEISQEQSRLSSGNNPPPRIYKCDQPVPVKKTHRKHRKTPRHHPDHDNHQQQQKEQFSDSTTVSRQSEDIDSARMAGLSCSASRDRIRNCCSWTPAHCEVIIQLLNMETLLPHLLNNNLLTQDEYEVIDRYKELPRKQNRYFLLSVLPRKGVSAYEKFLESLKTETEHLGHQDLIKLLANGTK